MINGLRERSDSPRLPKLPLRRLIPLKQHRHEVLAEDVFLRIFCWERKRAERSGRCFLLMLVHVESVLLANQSERTLSEIVSALSCSTRETDIAGWYREGAILGVIFAEICKAHRNELQSLMRCVQSWMQNKSIRSTSHFTCFRRIATKRTLGD